MILRNPDAGAGSHRQLPIPHAYLISGKNQDNLIQSGAMVIALGWYPEDKQQCPNCSNIDFESVFDPSQFHDLPAPHSAEGAPTPWTKYIRKILTFTGASWSADGSDCKFCLFLRRVASLVESHGSVASTPLSSWQIMSEDAVKSDPKLQDGEGYTLAATSSQFIYATFTSATESGDSASTTRTTQHGRPSVWLFVLKGSNTLERIAYEAQLRRSKISHSVITTVASYVRNHNTWIAEVSTDIGIYDFSVRVHAGLVHPKWISYEHLRSWVDSCVDHHPQCAAAMSGNKAMVPHLKLIDCKKRTLVSAKPDMKYVALSYVWGTGPPDKYTYPNLPTPLPATIEDAITVTLELGIQYIWIDRFCIWQDEPGGVHKTTQILHMTEIYGNAVVTIAASNKGIDPTYGLPGVSRPRSTDSQLIGRGPGGRLLVSGAIQSRQEVAIRKSVWDTRAWTYQEVALSPRVLFFTDLEVSFLCSNCEAFEHLSHPLSLTNAGPDGMTMRSTAQRAAREANGLGASSIVARYSRRNMTYGGDALRACVGVLSSWVQNNQNCFHYWGLPMRFPKVVSPSKPSAGTATDQQLCKPLWDALCWQLEQGSILSGARRDVRPEFPTWSWLSVEGRIKVNTNWDPRHDELRKETTLFVGGDQVPRYRFAVSESTEKKEDMIDWCDFVRSGRLSMTSPVGLGSELQGPEPATRFLYNGAHVPPSGARTTYVYEPPSPA